MGWIILCKLVLGFLQVEEIFNFLGCFGLGFGFLIAILCGLLGRFSAVCSNGGNKSTSRPNSSIRGSLSFLTNNVASRFSNSGEIR